MDNQNNELKSLNIYNLPRMDLIKDIKIDVNQIPMQSFLRRLLVRFLKYISLKKMNQNLKLVLKVSMKEIMAKCSYTIQQTK